MGIFVTEQFRFTTPAPPDAVWRTLTSPDLTGRWFHGLTLESDWQPGSTVTADGGAARFVGEVLANAEPRRLSFTLAAGDDQPETFVTWEVHDADAGGSIVRLYVDEPDGDNDTDSVWLPVISGLQTLLTATSGASPRS